MFFWLYIAALAVFSTPVLLVSHFHVSHFPPRKTATFSCLAFSNPDFLIVLQFHADADYCRCLPLVIMVSWLLTGWIPFLSLPSVSECWMTVAHAEFNRGECCQK